MDAEAVAATRRRVVLFVVCSMAGAVLVALVIAATGGLTNSPVLVAGTPLTLALVLLAAGYMFTPSAAHLLVRRMTGEGWAGARAVLRLRAPWQVWVVAWFAPVALTVVGAALFYALVPAAFDPALTAARGALRDALSGSPAPPGGELTLLVAQVAVSLTIAPLFNALFAFGEEFGWRGYLQPKLLALMSPSRAMVLMGVIWGVWHWPVIALGYEYGTGYPGAPWTGFATFLVFTFAAGTLLGWLTAHSASVLPAAVAHGAINATAGLGLLTLRGDADLLVGPLPIGIVGVLGYLAAALVLLRRWPSGRPPGTPPPASVAQQRAAA